MNAGIRRRRRSGNMYGPTYPAESSSAGSSSRYSPSAGWGRQRSTGSSAAIAPPRYRRRTCRHAARRGRLLGPGPPELGPGLVQRLGQDACLGHRRDEAGVAVPAGQGVHVEVAGDAGARRPPEVGAEVDPTRPIGALDRHDRPAHELPQLGRLLRLEVLELGHVANRQQHEVPTGVGVGVEKGGDQRPPPDHPLVLLVLAPGNDEVAQEARPLCPVTGLGRRLGDVRAAPPRPQVAEAAHAAFAGGSPRVSTSPRRRSMNASTGTSRSAPSEPRAFTPTVPAATSSSPTTSTYGSFSSLAFRTRALRGSSARS